MRPPPSGHAFRPPGQIRLDVLVRDLEARFESVERLTPREREVARLVAVGLLDKEIADVLGAAPPTVKAYLRHIFAKLAVDRRAAVAFVVAHTLLAPAGAAPRAKTPEPAVCTDEPAPPTPSETRMARKARAAHDGGRPS